MREIECVQLINGPFIVRNGTIYECHDGNVATIPTYVYIYIVYAGDDWDIRLLGKLRNVPVTSASGW